MKTTGKHWNQNYPTISLQHKHLPATSQKAENRIISKNQTLPLPPVRSPINTPLPCLQKGFASNHSQAAVGARQDCRTAWIAYQPKGEAQDCGHMPGGSVACTTQATSKCNHTIPLTLEAGHRVNWILPLHSWGELGMRYQMGLSTPPLKIIALPDPLHKHLSQTNGQETPNTYQQGGNRIIRHLNYRWQC